MKAKGLPVIIAIFLCILSLNVVHAQSGASQEELQNRIEQRKERLQERLTALQQARIQQRCQIAQKRIAAAREIASDFSQKNDKKIDALLDRLNNLSERQKNKGADTAVLQAVLDNLIAKSEAVKTAYDSYISALDDAAALDCQADPEGFMASLDDARDQFKELKTARQSLRQNLKNDLLAALEDFKLKEGE